MGHFALGLGASMAGIVNLLHPRSTRSWIPGQPSRNAHKQASRDHIVACGDGNHSTTAPFVYASGRRLHRHLEETVRDWAPGPHL